MNRCQHCGRTGGGMTPLHNRWVKRIDGYRCRNLAACNQRVRTLGQWTGVHVLRRIDRDGTEWTIQRGVGAPTRADVNGLDYVLTMAYRDHRLTSWHTSPDAAKAHVDDLLASWRARNMQDYAKGRG